MFGTSASPLDLHLRLFGTRVIVQPWFWLIAALIAPVPLNRENGIALTLLWILAVFFSILLHEFGHVWMWRVFGVHANILLHGLGGLAIADDQAPRRWQRILVSFAGPAIQLLLWAALLLLVLPLTKGLVRDYPSLGNFLQYLLIINLVWPLLNLLPIYPLDGGQIAREALQMASSRSAYVNSRPALVVSLWLSIATSVGFVLYILLPVFGIAQPYSLPIGPLSAVLFVLFAVNNYQELQIIRGRRGPMDDDW
ncbi:MAG: site-2 protease family protein [Gemmataceae bacterium]